MVENYTVLRSSWRAAEADPYRRQGLAPRTVGASGRLAPRCVPSLCARPPVSAGLCNHRVAWGDPSSVQFVSAIRHTCRARKPLPAQCRRCAPRNIGNVQCTHFTRVKGVVARVNRYGGSCPTGGEGVHFRLLPRLCHPVCGWTRVKKYTTSTTELFSDRFGSYFSCVVGVICTATRVHPQRVRTSRRSPPGAPSARPARCRPCDCWTQPRTPAP